MTAAVTAPAVRLPRRELSSLVAQIPGSTVIRLRRKEVVYGCLGRDPSIYLVEYGHVKVLSTSRDGKDCLLDVYGPGDLVGEVCLHGGVAAQTAVTMTPTLLRRISRARFLAALEHCGLREELVCYLAHRLSEQQQLITDFVTADSEYRLAAVLLHLARKMGRPSGPFLVLDLRITQEELSGMVGTTRSRVGLFLNRFIDNGLVHRACHGGLVVNETRLDCFMAQC